MALMTRRRFHQTLLGTTAFLCAPRIGRADTPADLVARAGRARLAPAGYPETEVWAYDGSVPGPTLRVARGARVSRRLVNDLPQASSVHWHGIRIDNVMDGVAGLTQGAVEPGADFLYDFTVPDAGTYWYHPHNRSWEQMARGLYGALIVDEAEGAPDVDIDEVLLLDDWRLTEDAQIAGGFGNMHDWAHAGRIGNWITVNGDGAWSRTVQHGARMRLRLVNTANARIFSLEARGLEGWVVALDGMPLETPRPLGQLALAPAQRADLIVDVVAGDGEEAMLVSFERDGGYAIAAFNVDGVARAERLPAAGPLPPNPVAALGSLETARRAELLMEGGAMGGMRGAMMNGRMMDMRDMASAGKVWAFNGMADMPDAPLIQADRGETVRISITNDTAWPHAMHLHGHHFRKVGTDGTVGPLRDTLLMNRGETADIAFVADNPGDWLLHCHMLEHSAGGMMTWLRVA
ncbi:FtsP/CotA-like multicopper oxidase with cupredoxin domain [Rhodovulum iodosum]|uniref:FtsP/CotA-like multicopper oxidase with cupredoxin domain n=1 Tax=Rhodovulum iodosum TaxID=68291 RepID=A0ABV3XTH1_9RHOB|nr:multicopper oxidase family protein [Rhodovulum robiginosum]RSK32096.1 multicopper oxidase family protein [Rhodovulum robiginosum]